MCLWQTVRITWMRWVNSLLVEGLMRSNHSQFVTLFQDFLHDIVLSETSSVSVLLNNCQHRLINSRFPTRTVRRLVGSSVWIHTFYGFVMAQQVKSMGTAVRYISNGLIEKSERWIERYNYDATQAFNYSTYPVSRSVMPYFILWLSFSSYATVI